MLVFLLKAPQGSLFTLWAHATPINSNESYLYVWNRQQIPRESLHSPYFVQGNDGNITKVDPKSRRIQPQNCHTWFLAFLLTVPPPFSLKHCLGAAHHAPKQPGAGPALVCTGGTHHIPSTLPTYSGSCFPHANEWIRSGFSGCIFLFWTFSKHHAH